MKTEEDGGLQLFLDVLKIKRQREQERERERHEREGRWSEREEMEQSIIWCI